VPEFQCLFDFSGKNSKIYKMYSVFECAFFQNNNYEISLIVSSHHNILEFFFQGKMQNLKNLSEFWYWVCKKNHIRASNSLFLQPTSYFKSSLLQNIHSNSKFRIFATEAFRFEKYTETSDSTTEVSSEINETFESVSISSKFRF
jgi:hypothetical protein